MRKICRPARFVVPFAFLAIGLTAHSTSGQSPPDYQSGSLRDGEPHPVYSPDVADSWNRIFNALFTRTVRVRLSGEFALNVPTERLPTERLLNSRFADIPFSKTVFERIESGDRAIEPLDGLPVHIGSNGSPQPVLDEPRFSRLRQALTEALREGPGRSPLSRALMQSDLWAGFDILAASRPRDEPQKGRREELLGLLARTIKMVQLTRLEIEQLPDNLAQARLPFDFSSPDEGWIEVEYLPERQHDFSSDFRRPTRVFLRPSTRPVDPQGWLETLRLEHGQRLETLAATALVTQLSLIDNNGVVVPSWLTYEVQVRSFPPGKPRTKPTETRLTVAELSRKALLLDRQAGGLILHGDGEPAYLPLAGNDYFFGSTYRERSGADVSVLASLRKRCEACHGEGVETMFTFSVHDSEPPIPIRILKPTDDDRPRSVAQLKMLRPDFHELKRRWDQ